MVGSGFYLSPSAVAPYGLLAIVMWIVMGAGAICLGLTFARLARARTGDGRTVCVHAAGIRRLRGIPDRVGLLDLDLGVAAGHGARVHRGDRQFGAGAARARRSRSR